MNRMLDALVASLALPVAAQAASPVAPAMPAAQAQSPYYVTAKLGVYSPQSDDMDAVGFNNGLSTEVQVGRRIHENFAAELGLGYFGSSTDEVGGVKAKLSVIPLTATAKGILPFGQLELYGLGGAGLYVSKVEVGSLSDDDTSLGLHLGAGAQYAVTPQLSLGLETRYVIAEVNDGDINGLLVNGAVAFHF